MPRHEPQTQTANRREQLHYLTLIKGAADQAAYMLALSDELAESARAPQLILAARLDGPQANGQAQKLQASQQIGAQGIQQVGELFAFAERLRKILQAKPGDPEPAQES